MPAFQFNPHTTRFDFQNAMRLAEASELAYHDKATIRDFVKTQWRMQHFGFLEAGPTQLFIAGNETATILAFRGTEAAEIQDWLTNFRTRRVKGAWGTVHLGFERALKSVWSRLREAIDFYQSHHQSLWITGHSLGGALAVLTAAQLVREKKDVHGVYTFGQPRVGDSQFARRYDEHLFYRTFRFANDNDIVARVPPRAMGYEHAGRSFYFDRHGRLHRDTRAWRRYLNQLAGLARKAWERFIELREQVPDEISDHRMGAYLSLLRTCKRREPS